MLAVTLEQEPESSARNLIQVFQNNSRNSGIWIITTASQGLHEQAAGIQKQDTGIKPTHFNVKPGCLNCWPKCLLQDIVLSDTVIYLTREFENTCRSRKCCCQLKFPFFCMILDVLENQKWIKILLIWVTELVGTPWSLMSNVNGCSN